MLETLKFVRAAVCKDGINKPQLTHFLIRNGTITATNGFLAIQAPIGIGLECCPHAGQFYKAVAACKDVISMHLSAGKLVITSGKFRTHVDLCDPTSFPVIQPMGAMYPIQTPIVPILKKLAPFVGTNPLRPWANGVLFTNNSAYATNNISIIEHWIPVQFPIVANLPIEAMNELIRLKIEPVAVQVDADKVTFHLPNGAWIAAHLSALQWPLAHIQKLFNELPADGPFVQGLNLEEILDSCERLSPFTDDMGKIVFHNGLISTVEAGEFGTTEEILASPGVGRYQAGQLLALRGVANTVAFAAYPRTVPFWGDNLRGVLFGIAPQPTA